MFSKGGSPRTPHRFFFIVFRFLPLESLLITNFQKLSDLFQNFLKLNSFCVAVWFDVHPSGLWSDRLRFRFSGCADVFPRGVR